jgi:hypothetical protein
MPSTELIVIGTGTGYHDIQHASLVRSADKHDVRGMCAEYSPNIHGLIPTGSVD